MQGESGVRQSCFRYIGGQTSVCAAAASSAALVSSICRLVSSLGSVSCYVAADNPASEPPVRPHPKVWVWELGSLSYSRYLHQYQQHEHQQPELRSQEKLLHLLALPAPLGACSVLPRGGDLRHFCGLAANGIGYHLHSLSSGSTRCCCLQCAWAAAAPAAATAPETPMLGPPGTKCTWTVRREGPHRQLLSRRCRFITPSLWPLCMCLSCISRIYASKYAWMKEV